MYRSRMGHAPRDARQPHIPQIIPQTSLGKSALRKGWGGWGECFRERLFSLFSEKVWPSSVGGDRQASRWGVSDGRRKDLAGIDGRARLFPSPPDTPRTVSAGPRA